MDFPRLIEHAFPLEATSLDSVHEKNVRHGHISTLHIWPARRPLAACRAALIATLLPDPGDAEKRKELCEKIAGKVVTRTERKKMPNGQTVERLKKETEGGILHWGRETENAETLEWFRQEIRKAYGGRAPKVLDPFAGGGAIPLEAMRLGCEVTAVDINPVAWFILKCTLEYPQKLAGQTRPLPEFILHNDAFMAEFFSKAKGYSKAETKAALQRLRTNLQKKVKWNAKKDQKNFAFDQGDAETANEYQADLAWHVRAWGQWVLDRARRELAQFYPTYADFEPLKKDHIAYEHQPMCLIPLKEDGNPDLERLNAEFTQEYLEDSRNPRWVAKRTVAYLWARTVTCKNCRVTMPLLKTRWLARKGNQRVLLTIVGNPDGQVHLEIESDVPSSGANSAQRRENDKRLGEATMSRAGARCPCCGTIMTSQDIRVEGRTGRLGKSPVAAVVQGTKHKEYRSLTVEEKDVLRQAECRLNEISSFVPFGLPNEAIPVGASRSTGGSPFTVHIYGMTNWGDLFTPRQMLAIATLSNLSRSAQSQIDEGTWAEALQSYLVLMQNRLVNTMTTNCTWNVGPQSIRGTYARYALPITWDFVELNPLGPIGASYSGAIDSIGSACEFVLSATRKAFAPKTTRQSVLTCQGDKFDLIITDPPYYDAIPYSDLMDLFYIWLRRTMSGASDEFEKTFSTPLSPKWDHAGNDGELIDDPARYEGSRERSKAAYEDGMARAFQACHLSLNDDGRLVIVFAHKHPDAWETLVGALIRAGFVVDSSWPIQTEREARTRALTSSALASSVWMVCRKRTSMARPGWDNNVLGEMRANISVKLREFWDAGIRGPDFVWAATGPAMEAYSKHPVVRKADSPGEVMSVSEFLNHVRRMVVDYVVGQVLSGERGADLAAADRLDEVSAYYLLHRHDFGLEDAPAGACILYATACGLSDAELEKTWDILSHAGGSSSSGDDDESDETDDADEETEPSEDSGGGSKVKLKPWNLRRGKSMGHEAPSGRAVPLIDRIHRLMHLWKDGDLLKVDEYLDQHALRRNELFKRVVQSLIELSSDNERSLMESISNHIGSKGARANRSDALPFGEDE